MRTQLIAALLASSLVFCGCQAKPTPSTSPTAGGPDVVSTASPATELPVAATLGDLSSQPGEGVSLVPDHEGKEKSAFAFVEGHAGLSSEVNIDPSVLPQCTFVTWAKYTGPTENQSSVQQLVSHDDGGFDRSMGIDSRAGQWGWSAFAGSQGVLGGFPITAGEWTFLAVSYDQEAKKVVFYAGDQKAEAEDATMGSGLESASAATNPSYGEFFLGEMEPIRVYHRVLTEEEIRKLREQ